MTAQTSKRTSRYEQLLRCMSNRLARWLDVSRPPCRLGWSTCWLGKAAQPIPPVTTKRYDRPIPGWQRRRDKLQDRPLWRRHRSCRPSGRRSNNPRCRWQTAADNPTQWRIRYSFSDDKGNMLSLREGFGTALEREAPLNTAPISILSQDHRQRRLCHND